MASVIKQKWGAMPSFLNIKKPKTLFQLVGHYPSFEGVKVTTKEWFNKGLDENYFLVTRLEMNPDLSTGIAFGHEFVKGVQMSSSEKQIPNANTAQWKLLNIEESVQILKKLSESIK